MQNSEGNVNLPRENLIKSGGGGDYHRRTLYPGGRSNTYIRFMSRKLHGIAQAMYRISFDNFFPLFQVCPFCLLPGCTLFPSRFSSASCCTWVLCPCTGCRWWTGSSWCLCHVNITRMSDTSGRYVFSLNPRRDQHLISPRSKTTESFIKIRRINEMIANLRVMFMKKIYLLAP